MKESDGSVPDRRARRIWDGKDVRVRPGGLGELFERRPVTINLTEEAARRLALSLARLKQTTFTVPEEIEELLEALNYSLVGDPDSRAAHRRMEAGKGMTPDGGYRKPEQGRLLTGRRPREIKNEES